MEIPQSYNSPYFIIDREVSHGSQAKSNNIWQFKTKDNIEKMIDILLNQLQVISTDVLKAQRGLSIERGTTWMLDLVGKSLQVYRGDSQSDEDFRKSIVQKISEDSSQGTIEDILSVVSFVVDEGVTPTLIEAHPASIIIQVPFEAIDLSQGPLARIRRVTAAGVGSNIHVRDETQSNIFSFDPSEGGFSATGFAAENGAMVAVLKEVDNVISPFRLDLQQGVKSGFGATDALDQGQLVDLTSYVDTTGDGLPDSPTITRIEAKNYTP